MYKVPNFQLIELIIPATVTGALQQTFFQSQPQLQSYDGGEQVYVKSIQTYTNKSLIFSPLTSGNPVASAVDIANAVINFSINGKLRMQYLPLARLNLLNDNTGGEFVLLQDSLSCFAIFSKSIGLRRISQRSLRREQVGLQLLPSLIYRRRFRLLPGC